MKTKTYWTRQRTRKLMCRDLGDQIIDYMETVGEEDYISSVELSRALGVKPLRLCNALRKLADRKLLHILEGGMCDRHRSLQVKLLPKVGASPDTNAADRHRRMAEQLVTRGLV